MTSQATKLFAQRAYEDGVPGGVVYLLCRNCGLTTAAARQLAEDAAAEAHSRALPREFESDEHYRNWVARTGKNWAIDELRRRRRLRQVPIDDRCLTAAEELDSLLEQVPRLEEAIAALPDDERAVIRLTLAGATLDQIAEELEPGVGGSANAKRLRAMRKRDVAIRRLHGYLTQGRARAV